MKSTIRFAAACALLSSLTACGAKDKAAQDTATATTTETTTATTAPAPTTPTTENPTAEAAPTTTATTATFDISSVPVSTANLGTFPYLSSLKDYEVNTSNSEFYEFERAYVYDGKKLVTVEGKVSQRLFGPQDRNKKASELMISRNYETLLKNLGATKVSSTKVPREVIDKVGDDVYKYGKWSISTDHVTDTYLIRQKDKEVWLQVTPLGSDGGYNLTAVERAPMPQQATVLPADELKKN